MRPRERQVDRGAAAAGEQLLDEEQISTACSGRVTEADISPLDDRANLLRHVGDLLAREPGGLPAGFVDTMPGKTRDAANEEHRIKQVWRLLERVERDPRLLAHGGNLARVRGRERDRFPVAGQRLVEILVQQGSFPERRPVPL